MNTELKLAKVKAKLILEQPFFGAIICNLPMIEDDTINPPTMCTNGQWVRFHPAFVEKSTFDELVFVVCHEVMHVAMQHMCRLNGRDARKWNYATDYVINDLLVKDNVGTMPKCGLLDQNLVVKGGGTSEGVYALLPELPDNGPGQGGGQGQGAPGPLDQLIEAGRTEAERSEMEARLKVMVAQAAQAAKMCGKLSSNMERFVTNALKPKVDWREVLRRFVSTRAKVEPTYARPKRRFIDMDLYLPSLGGDSMGELVVAVDCSGSIGQQELDEFAAEMSAIKDDVRPSTLHVIYFHHEVCGYDRFGQDDELTVTPRGTGGTAFSPIFKHVDELGIEPAACVVLTDLCCSDFGPPTAYPTLWVTTHSEEAPWGEIVSMKS